MNEMYRGLGNYLSKEELETISRVNIGIAGCGGLGSNCAHALVRLGFLNFTLVDFDRVEPSNLNRQFFFIKQIGVDKTAALKSNLHLINPDLNIETKTVRVSKENIKTIFSESEIVVEAFDSSEAKLMLLEELGSRKKIVSGSGLGEYWNVDGIKTNEVSDNLIFIGDHTSDVEYGVSPLSPGVQVAAAKQAGAVLKMVLKELVSC